MVSFTTSSKYQAATTNVRSMSDLDDLMAALDEYEDPNVAAPPDVIAASKAASLAPKFKNWSKKLSGLADRGGQPKLANVVVDAVNDARSVGSEKNNNASREKEVARDVSSDAPHARTSEGGEAPGDNDCAIEENIRASDGDDESGGEFESVVGNGSRGDDVKMKVVRAGAASGITTDAGLRQALETRESLQKNELQHQHRQQQERDGQDGREEEQGSQGSQEYRIQQQMQAADSVIMQLLMNDVSTNSKPVTMGKITVSSSNRDPHALTSYKTATWDAAESSAPAAAWEDDPHHHIVPNLSFAEGDGVPLEFDDELPTTIPVTHKTKRAAIAKAKVKRKGAVEVCKGSPPKPRRRSVGDSGGARGGTSADSSPRNGLRRSPNRSSRSPRKNSTSSKNAGRLAIPHVYSQAFNNRYFSFLQRLASTFDSSDISGLEMKIEEMKMERALSECLREMLSNEDIMETLKLGAYKKISKVKE